MALVSFGVAAQLCGHKSRSTLYNLRKAGLLEPYLGVGPKGHPWIETHPPGREPLISYVFAAIRLQANSPMLRREERQAPPPAPAPRRAPPGELPWDGYVREAGPEEPGLSHEEFWANVAALFDASANDVFPPRMTWQQCHSIWLLLMEAMETIEGGGRWDETAWLRASLSDATEFHEREWVEGLLASGRLSPELEAQARQFLAAAP